MSKGKDLAYLKSLSREFRLDVLNTVYLAGFGHIGGSYSCIDLLTSLYFTDLFNFDHDHFVLSAGHLCLSLYAVLAKVGKIPKDLLPSYGEFGSILQGHVSADIPGIEYSSGSLGQGLSFSAGLALGDHRHMTICLTTDGEHDEGQTWEAVTFAKKYQLGNLINIVDCNGLQIGGSTDSIMPLGNLASRYLAAGWTVTTVNGHNFSAIIKALTRAKEHSIYPTCIIANTVLGKGVSYMENDYHYHDVKNLPDELYELALRDLQKA
jgi:transketolase